MKKSSSPVRPKGSGTSGGGGRGRGGEVGAALRKAYDKTLHEGIPPAMLDLLGKLD